MTLKANLVNSENAYIILYFSLNKILLFLLISRDIKYIIFLKKFGLKSYICSHLVSVYRKILLALKFMAILDYSISSGKLEELVDLVSINR